MELREVSILVAGSGGQGILLLGRLIACGGMKDGKEVTCFPSYGAEMRGGTANCTVIISDEMIGSPIVRNPRIMIAMNEASLKRFQPCIESGGLLLYDSSLIRSPELRRDVRTIGIPASEIAAALNLLKPGSGGSIADLTQVRSANMVMFGAFIGVTEIVREGSAMEALEKLTSEKRKKAIATNREAIRQGIQYVAGKKDKDRGYQGGT
jgi:2-oxoglutarate ferredoxin oxidoreductase subunit gamma